MERLREGFHQKGKIYQQDVFSWCIQRRLKLLDVMVIKSHNTCTSQLVSSIGFGCLSPSRCSLQNIKEECLRSLALRFVFDTVLICVSLTNGNLLQYSLILLGFHFDRKKKTDNNHINRYIKIQVHKQSSLSCSLICLYFDARQRRIGPSIAWFST